ncbi:3'(2'),5'-bisphosphate nucleotidase CysQ [Pedobacter sp. MC2016-14]|uniref:3'(2'),5'-bisphosphate nucleotidase CysQ n=1 Tax=Pedobacter sp. MC2016-14 TaxID=2897327 RepID=UPI001E469869|nr:3'(2'),5'-bisphosphate nucleotidase CysQ [Pedobacter sp. MC2016-14]MCD0490537.1 3'(2'),5'-bisphosphate nucleotidase CysQ [Pedobacter sp. MC2016-14]
MIQIDIKEIVKIAVQAGEAILKVYNAPAPVAVMVKEDNSPLTLADELSHGVIMEGLTRLYPDIPVLSEEGSQIDYEIRKNWTRYWCVDPLDGTKEFIKRNGEFTVNIALMENNKPVLGVIYAPVLNDIYYGSVAGGSWMQVPGQEAVQIKADVDATEWLAIGSRSHADEEEENVLKAFPVTGKLSIGSSLKFCLIASGKAHIYYRKGPTMEWDTAAGHAIALGSGAIMLNAEQQEFIYNKPSLLNPGFFCMVK